MSATKPGVYRITKDSFMEGKNRLVVKCVDGRKIVTAKQLEDAEEGHGYYLTIRPDGNKEVSYGKIHKTTQVEASPEPKSEDKKDESQSSSNGAGQQPSAN